MTDKLILVGRVAGAFGVKGEARITAFTADPMNLASYGPLLNKAGAPALTILSARPAVGPAAAASAPPGPSTPPKSRRGGTSGPGRSRGRLTRTAFPAHTGASR